MKASRLKQQHLTEEGLDKVQYLPIIYQIVQTLQRYLHLNNIENGNDSENNLIVSDLSNIQKDAIYTDINELAVYSKMYNDIETVKSDP